MALESIEEKYELLRKYYSGATLWLPPKSAFRQFRLFFVNKNGSMQVVKVKDRVKTEESLRKWLIRYLPFHVFYSTSLWLDSQNLGPMRYTEKKAGYEFAYNVFLGQELYFDIDIPGDLDLCKEKVMQLINALKDDYGLQPSRLVYSGSKGFHIHVYDWNLQDFVDTKPADPRYRETLTQEVKAQIVENLLSKGLVFDADVTLDTRRMIRLPLSINGKTFNICQFVINLETFTPQRLVRE